MNHLAAIIPFALLKPLVRSHQLILCIGNFRTDFLGGQELFVHVQPLQNFLQSRCLIIIIIDHKGAGIAQLFNIPAENFRTSGVEGGNPGIFRLFPHQLADALPHFLGSFIGEGQCQNRPWLHTVIHQVGHTAGQCLGFSAASTCENQHRSFQSFSSQPLLLIQHRKIHFLILPSFSPTHHIKRIQRAKPHKETNDAENASPASGILCAYSGNSFFFSMASNTR